MKIAFSRRAAFFALSTCLFAFGFADAANTEPRAVTPFGANLKVPTKTLKPLAAPPAQLQNVFDPATASTWSYDNQKPEEMAGVHSLEQVEGKAAVRIATAKFVPTITTLRTILPADANGDLWFKNKANYISLLCKSDKPVTMSLHLLKRGKTPGTYRAAFPVSPGQWQRVSFFIEQFDLKNFSGVVGLAFRVAGAPVDTNVYFADVTVGATAYSDTSWASHRLSISLKGDWRFATDPNNEGLAKKWEADNFDDSTWKVLQSGLSWQEQGEDYAGWGWYRQKVFVPKEFAGIPLTLNLAPNPSDDDTYINGVRIGGWSGEYKYNVHVYRSYTVPASAIRYGENNTIAMRIWGGNLSFIGNKSGLGKGTLTAELDPYRVMARENANGTEQPIELLDLSSAQQGKPFELVFRFPGDLAKDGATLQYDVTDFVGASIISGKTPLAVGNDGIARAVVAIDNEKSKTVYLRGRLKANLTVYNGEVPAYISAKEMDRLRFDQRDNMALPVLAQTLEDTPYGKLRLVDEIDAARDISTDPHPYMQSGFDKAFDRQPPGAALDVKVTDILGKKARESGYGWFAYRVGRGKLKPHSTYLLRIEYPEDKPRFAPIEIQTGQNYSDVGWKTGVGPDDVYDNWPLSKAWQWYDVIVPLDDNTTGAGGTGTASAENGFWVYFMNKVRADRYYAMWQGGPAVARIKLYEIDPEKNAPLIRKPQGLPSRTLSFDWERQPDHDPADLIKYAKLMGYNTISPVIIKWAFANYSEPLNGYDTVNIDAGNYWTTKRYEPGSGVSAGQPVPGKKSPHVQYLEATKNSGVNYVPRFEYGGSEDLPIEAYALDAYGAPTKPNRFAQWCANLLHPATWDDTKKLMDHLIKPYTKDNPQLVGALWRIRSTRMPISYGKADVELFCKETNTPLPAGGENNYGVWASGEGKAKYDEWWHKKRAEFHAKMAELLRSYRSDLALSYYNWDEDKFGLIQPDITAWAFVSNVVKPLPEGGRAAYEKERASRKKLTGADYIEVMRTGNFGTVTALKTNRADYGIRPELYKNIKGVRLYAPANYLCYADKPDYINYFQTADGLAVSNVVSYDEIGARTINPKYEGNMVTPAGANFSMALEVLPYFHGDAGTLNYTVYTYGRGFADAHRRFAQAFLALPATKGQVVEGTEADLKVRQYPGANGTYVGVAWKAYDGKKLTIKLPGTWKAGVTITDQVTGATVPSSIVNNQLQFEVNSGPMELNSFLVK